MTLHDWIETMLALLGMVGAVFGWLWNENRKAKERATAKDTEIQARMDTRDAAWNGKLELIERRSADGDYNVKKDVFDKLREEKDILHERCLRIEREHEQGRSEFTAALNKITETFARTCEAIQHDLKHLTSTIIGQYVPRAELDARFEKTADKQDKILDILIELKK